MKKISTRCLTLTLLALTTSFAQQSPAPVDPYADRLRRFEEFVRQRMEQDRIPGLTIGFYKDDYTWVKGFGYADVENKLPAKVESAYRLASITKSFTGVAILQLVEQGKMKLDAEIQTYLPYYPKQRWPVTVQQLLVHTGGGQQGSGLGPAYVSPKDVVARIAKFPIQIEPGTRYEYTTSGYNLLGAAVEEVAGMPLGEYFRKNIFAPLGLKDTRMDSLTELIPNRVRSYQMVKGELKNIEPLDVSTRFGGGGLTGTVPDLLAWARQVDDGRVLSKASLESMYTPVTTKGGRWVGIGDGALYYTLGWVLFPVNGQLIIENNGAQIGTNTELVRIPAKRMTIAFACNIQEIDRMPYIKRLYELLTDEPYDINVFTRDRTDQAIFAALKDTFNYGSLHFERTGRPLTTGQQELAEAFAYLNRAASRSALSGDYSSALKAITDGRHPIGGSAFLKAGSYMAMKLREKHGAESIARYSATGTLPFFADYVALYRADARHPREFRLSEELEALSLKWSRDWGRAWNSYTRQLRVSPGSDLDAIGTELRKLFRGAEVRPDFVAPLCDIQEGVPALKAAKLAVELYPESARANGNYGLLMLLGNVTEERRAYYRQHLGGIEPALEYFKKSLALNPEGLAGVRVLGQITTNWTNQDRLDDALALLNVAVELHSREPRFLVGQGEIHRRQGRKEKAVEAAQQALALNPDFAPARELLKRLNQ
jgi:CubicO group peptidase (beta-lactamase class C family)